MALNEYSLISRQLIFNCVWQSSTDENGIPRFWVQFKDWQGSLCMPRLKIN